MRTRRIALSLLAVALGGCTSAASSDSVSASGPTTVPALTSTSESAADTNESAPASSTPVRELTGYLGYEIVATYPHDSAAYTQGLELNDGVLFESTGLYGESDRRIVDLASGSVIRSAPLSDDHFGEGLTIVGDEIYQLTWQSGQVLVSDRESLDLKRSIPFDTEGWGLCNAGETLALSNGSAVISFRDPHDFATVSQITVTDDNGVAQQNLNELECLDGVLLANVYQSSFILIIDQQSGSVRAVVDLAALVPASDDAAFDVLNGITYRAETDTFLVTGKRWDTIYELRLFPA